MDWDEEMSHTWMDGVGESTDHKGDIALGGGFSEEVENESKSESVISCLMKPWECVRVTLPCFSEEIKAVEMKELKRKEKKRREKEDDEEEGGTMYVLSHDNDEESEESEEESGEKEKEEEEEEEERADDEESVVLLGKGKGW